MSSRNLTGKDRQTILSICLLAVVSYIFARNFTIPLSVDGGLALADKSGFAFGSLMADRNSSTWSGLDQLCAAWIQLGLPEELISWILTFLVTLGFALSTFAVYRLAKASVLASLVISIFSIIAAAPWQLAFRSDYPLLIGTRYIHGEYALMLSIAALALFAYQRYALGTATIGILVCVHPVWGLYSGAVLIGLMFVPDLSPSGRRKLALLQILRGFACVLPIILLSFLVFVLDPRRGSFISTYSDAEIALRYSEYLNAWDFHRNVEFQPIAVLLSLATGGVILFTAFWNKVPRLQSVYLDKESKRVVVSLATFSALGAIAYVILKGVQSWLFVHDPQSLINTLIPGRFMNLSAWFSPILVYYSFKATLSVAPRSEHPVFEKLKPKLRGRLALILGTLLVVAITASAIVFIPSLRDRLRPVSDTFVGKLGQAFTSFDLRPQNVGATSQSDFTLKTCPTLVGTKNVLAFGAASTNIPRLCHVPVILETGNLDFFVYTPRLVPEVARVVEELYGVPFDSPKESSKTGGLDGAETRIAWEQRTPERWRALSCEFGFTRVVAPSVWTVRLRVLHQSQTDAVYEVECD